MLYPPLFPLPSSPAGIEMRMDRMVRIQHPKDGGAMNQKDCCYRARSCQTALIALKPGLFRENEQTSTCLSHSYFRFVTSAIPKSWLVHLLTEASGNSLCVVQL